MAYVIGDSCISCGSCEGQCLLALSLWEKASSKSTLLNALTAVPAQVSVLLALSLRAESKPHESNM